MTRAFQLTRARSRAQQLGVALNARDVAAEAAEFETELVAALQPAAVAFARELPRRPLDVAIELAGQSLVGAETAFYMARFYPRESGRLRFCQPAGW